MRSFASERQGPEALSRFSLPLTGDDGEPLQPLAARDRRHHVELLHHEHASCCHLLVHDGGAVDAADLNLSAASGDVHELDGGEEPRDAHGVGLELGDVDGEPEPPFQGGEVVLGHRHDVAATGDVVAEPGAVLVQDDPVAVAVVSLDAQLLLRFDDLDAGLAREELGRRFLAHSAGLGEEVRGEAIVDRRLACN